MTHPGSPEPKDSTSGTEPVDFETAFRGQDGRGTDRESELASVVRRRRAAGLPTAGGAAEDRPPGVGDDVAVEDAELAARSLVGLTLSGGGLRAATFSLGVMQALRAKGLLRYVDYLVSVSGGGYTAGYLGAQAVDASRRCRPAAVTPRAPAADGEPPPSDGAEAIHEDAPRPKKAACDAGEPAATGAGRSYHDLDAEKCLAWRRPEMDRAEDRGNLGVDDHAMFGNCGRYLVRPWEFLGDYVPATLVSVTLFLSGLTAAAALLAILYRTLDTNETRDVAGLVMRNFSEVFLAFVPTIIVGLLWLTMRVGRLMNGRSVDAGGHDRLGPLRWGLFLSSGTWLVAVLTGSGEGEFWLGGIPSLVSLVAAAVMPCATVAILTSPRDTPRLSRLAAALGRPTDGYRAAGWSIPTLTVVLPTLVAGVLAAVYVVMYLGWLDPASTGVFATDAFGDTVVRVTPLGWVAWVVVALILVWQWAYLGSKKFTDLLLRLTIGGCLLSVVLCLTNGYLNVGVLGEVLNLTGLPTVGQESLRNPAIAFVLISVLAMTQYQRLINSQRPGASLTERVILKLVVTGLVAGIPLTVFGMIAKENVSGVVTHRDAAFHVSDVDAARFALLSEWWDDPVEGDGHSGREVFFGNSIGGVDDASLNVGEAIRKVATRDADLMDLRYGKAGWQSQSRGFTTAETGRFARTATALIPFGAYGARMDELIGSSVASQDERDELRRKLVNRVEAFATGDGDAEAVASTLSVEDEVAFRLVGLTGRGIKATARATRSARDLVAARLSVQLNRPEMTRLLGDIIVKRAEADDGGRIRLPDVREYLFTTALGDMADPHRAAEDRELRQFFDRAVEHLKYRTERAGETSDEATDPVRRFDISLRPPADKTPAAAGDESEPVTRDEIGLVGVSIEQRRPAGSSVTEDRSPTPLFAVDAKDADDAGYWTPGPDAATPLARFNRLLLERLFPDMFKRARLVSTPVVIRQDQTVRTRVFVCATLLFAGLFFTVPVNRISPMQKYYRRKIGGEFLRSNVKPDGKPRPGRPVRLRELAEAIDFGCPVPLFVADLRFGAELATDTHAANTSDARRNHPYTYSPFHQGSPSVGYRRVRTGVAGADPRLDLAVANSGAAISPAAMADGPLRWVMAAFNLRLEQWVFRSDLEDAGARRGWLRRHGVRPCDVFAEWTRGWVCDDDTAAGRLRDQSSDAWRRDWQAASISDGGYSDFLGIGELLRRRCRVVVVIDCSINKGASEFAVLGEAIRVARRDFECEILDLDEDRPLDVRRLRRGEDGLTPQHMVLGRILYHADDPPRQTPPDDGQPACGETADPRPDAAGLTSEGLLVYVQMARSGDEDVDVEQFARAVPTFPDHPTADQAFGESMVAAYRTLGRHVGEQICAGLPDHAVLERARRAAVAAGRRPVPYLTTGGLAACLIESYRTDCREINIDRRDDLRRLPAFAVASTLAPRLSLPDEAVGYPAAARGLYAGAVTPGPFQGPTGLDALLQDRRNDRVCLQEERFLRLYEGDSNLRYRIRMAVQAHARSDWDIYEDGYVPIDQVSAYVVACHEFCLTSGDESSWQQSYISEDRGGMRISDGRDLLLGEDRFQAGGRLELLAASARIAEAIRVLQDPAAHEANGKDSLADAAVSIRLAIAVIADAVFRYRGGEAAIMVADFFRHICKQTFVPIEDLPSDPFESAVRVVRELNHWGDTAGRPTTADDRGAVEIAPGEAGRLVASTPR